MNNSVDAALHKRIANFIVSTFFISWLVFLAYAVAIAQKRDEWWAIGACIACACSFIYGGLFVRNASLAGMLEEKNDEQEDTD